jgi:hypothetical protein
MTKWPTYAYWMPELTKVELIELLSVNEVIKQIDEGDPDGPLEPMHPMAHWKDRMTQEDIDELVEWDISNAFLIRALRFT